MADVQAHGSQPVPPHLLPAAIPAMRRHGIGVGYRYPHDYPDADVEQQYLPEILADRRYYVPSDQGMETQIGARLERLKDAREAARAAGGPRPAPPARGAPRKDPMRVADRVMKTRDDAKRRTAEKEKKDATGG